MTRRSIFSSLLCAILALAFFVPAAPASATTGTSHSAAGSPKDYLILGQSFGNQNCMWNIVLCVPGDVLCPPAIGGACPNVGPTNTPASDVDWAITIRDYINANYSPQYSATHLGQDPITGGEILRVTGPTNFQMFAASCPGCANLAYSQVGFPPGGTVCLGAGGAVTVQRYSPPPTVVPAMPVPMLALLFVLIAGAFVLRQRRMS